MEAQVHSLYKSGFFEIKNFICQCTDCNLSKPEYQDRFCICFIRRGNFRFKVFHGELDSFTGYCLLNKPGIEYRVAHTRSLPDECTIFSFSAGFYEQLVNMHALI